MPTLKCSTCSWYKEEEVEGYWFDTEYGTRRYQPSFIYVECTKTLRAIRKMRSKCKHYISVHQTTIQVGEKGMVKLEDIPSEGERLELKDLPPIMELKAVSEKDQEATSGKAGGLVITFETRDGGTFPQKYHKVAGKELRVAMEKLGLTETEQLQADWYEYHLKPMRIGKARMIPQKWVKA